MAQAGSVQAGRASAAHPGSTPATTEKRALERRKSSHRAMLLKPGGAERLHLLNINSLGALGYMFVPPREGTVCQLTLLDQPVEARVVWQQDRKFGLSFTTPISNELVALLVAVG